jgi:hypothetical protein
MKGTHQPWVRGAKWVIMVAVVLLILNALRHFSGEVKSHVTRIRWGVLFGGYILCIVYRVLNSAGWVMILRGMRQHMPLFRGMRLWLTAESMRWLPGTVWGFASRVYQASRNGIPAVVASASLPVEILLTVGAWSLAAAGGLLASKHSVDWRLLASRPVIAFCVGGIFVVGSVILISIWAFPQGRIRGKWKKFVGDLQSQHTIRIRWRNIAGVLVFYTVLCCLNGLAFYVVLRSVSEISVDPVAVIGINAFGWLLGFLAVGAPAGIGVREAGSAMLLSTLMPLPTAIAASVLWRVVMILDELTCLSACLFPTLAAKFKYSSSISTAPTLGRAHHLPYEAGQK